MVPRLLLAYTALLILLALTVSLSFISLGQWSLVASLAISSVKTLLIVLFFMQLLHATNLIRFAALSGIVWLAILFTLSFSDYFLRSVV